MNGDADNNVYYLNSPDMGSIGGSAIEGFKAPVIERPSTGIVENVSKPIPVIAPEDNTAALSSVRTSLAAENPSVPFHINQANLDATARIMEDNEKVEERQRQPVIVKESTINTALKLTGRAISSVLQRK